MVNRHSAKRAVQLFYFPGHYTSNFLDLGDTVGSGVVMQVSNHLYRDLIQLAIPFLGMNDLVMNANFVVVQGTRYSKKSVVLIARDLDEFPKFGRVMEIVVHGQDKLLVYRPLQTLFFERMLNAYRVKDDNVSCRWMFVRDLVFPHPLSVWKCAGESYVVLFDGVPEFFG